MLNPTMLSEIKKVIFEDSKLMESVQEPIHMSIVNSIMLEYAYEDFLSRETAGADVRADSLRLLITQHGGDITAFNEWFSKYESGKAYWSQ